jgi:hypothetical protein
VKKSDADARQHVCVAYNLLINVRCDSETGHRAGTKYDWKVGCPQCGCGATVVGPYRLTPSALPKSAPLARNDGGELLVHRSIRDTLIARFGASTKDFVPVSPRQDDTHLPWFMLWPQMVLPPAAVKESKIEFEPRHKCDLCGRPGHYNGTVIEYMYHSDAWPKNALPALMRSWEHYGGWTRNPPGAFRLYGVATPLIVMRSDAMSWIAAVATRYCKSNPVTLIWKR